MSSIITMRGKLPEEGGKTPNILGEAGFRRFTV
jgi:hypothetical protein